MPQLELKYEAEYLKTGAAEPSRADSSSSDSHERLPSARKVVSEEEYRQRQKQRMERVLLAREHQETQGQKQARAKVEVKGGREHGVEHRRQVVRLSSLPFCLFFIRRLFAVVAQVLCLVARQLCGLVAKSGGVLTGGTAVSGLPGAAHAGTHLGSEYPARRCQVSSPSLPHPCPSLCPLHMHTHTHRRWTLHHVEGTRSCKGTLHCRGRGSAGPRKREGVRGQRGQGLWTEDVVTGLGLADGRWAWQLALQGLGGKSTPALVRLLQPPAAKRARNK